MTIRHDAGRVHCPVFAGVGQLVVLVVVQQARLEGLHGRIPGSTVTECRQAQGVKRLTLLRGGLLVGPGPCLVVLLGDPLLHAWRHHALGVVQDLVDRGGVAHRLGHQPGHALGAVVAGAALAGDAEPKILSQLRVAVQCPDGDICRLFTDLAAAASPVQALQHHVSPALALCHGTLEGVLLGALFQPASQLAQLLGILLRGQLLFLLLQLAQAGRQLDAVTLRQTHGGGVFN